MVMADRPLVEFCPVEWARMDNRSVLQWDKDDCAAAGLVKFDLLGLGMLTMLHLAVDLIRDHDDTDIDLATIFSDPAPLEALIQRFGRINRRRLQPGLAPVHVFREPSDGQHVYDEGLVRASLEILERASGNPIDEAELGGWLDSIYEGDARKDWENTFGKSLREGQSILRGLCPFQSDESLADLFDAAFDSVEILPADFLPEYDHLREDAPIRASELLVPISDRRRRQLWRDGRIRPRTQPPVVDVPYSSEIGLDFAALGGSGG